MTYSNCVVNPIIGAKVGSQKPSKQFFRLNDKRDGPDSHALAPVVKTLTVDEAGEGQRLDNLLFRHLKGVPKTHVYRVIRSGEVRVNQRRASVDTRLALGDVVRIPPVRMAAPTSSHSSAAAAPAREFELVFEDEQLLVINKPAGVAVHGGSGVSFGVIEQLRQARPQARFLELVHRLDRETSGLLMVAKKRSALLALQNQFRDRQIDKTYAALVKGLWPVRHKVVDVALHKYIDAQGERRVRAVPPEHEDGRRSVSLVHVVHHLGDFSLLDVTIKTGRTHQIRVHLSAHGFPIVGDDKYGDFAFNKTLSRGQGLGPCRLSRMFLHAKLLRFVHPATQAVIELVAPLPAECLSLLATLQTGAELVRSQPNPAEQPDGACIKHRHRVRS